MKSSPTGLSGSRIIAVAYAIATATFVALFAGFMLALHVGIMLGSRRAKQHEDGAIEGHGAFEGAVFGLMGLLVAFTFAGAAERFDSRRELIGQETNAIEKAYQRLDLLPPAATVRLRPEFRDYITQRLAVYESLPDQAASDHAAEAAKALSEEMWTQAVEATRDAPSPAIPQLVLGALNDMGEIATTRAVANETHPPSIVYMLLVIAIFASAIFAGFAMGAKRSNSLLHTIGFALLMSIAVYVILDMELPREGLIRIDKADHFLVELKNSMK